MGYLNGAPGTLAPAVLATIANSAQESSAITCNGLSLTGFFIPAAFTGTAITFEASPDGVTYYPVVGIAGALSVTVTTSTYYAVDSKNFQGIAYLRLKSGTSEGGARTITCALKGI